MRVIAGTRRRIQLNTIEGSNTRPTTDRIKETLFNMIQDEIYGARFLDLFSGSGQIGIEALSRGAAFATFVEKNPKAFKCIEDNIKKTKFEAESSLISRDVLSALSTMKSEPFSIVFMDPPYNTDVERDVLISLKDKSLIDEDSLIIIEASLESDFSYVNEIGFDILKEKIYKTNKHTFLTLR